MPHHSKNPASQPQTSSPVASSHLLPSHHPRGHHHARSLQQPSFDGGAPASTLHGSSSQEMMMYHRVPDSPAIGKNTMHPSELRSPDSAAAILRSSENSTPNRDEHDELRKRNNHSDAAASVMLLATAAMRQQHENSHRASAHSNSQIHQGGSSSYSVGSRPLKKRKNHAALESIHRSKFEETKGRLNHHHHDDSIHVSPISQHSTKSSASSTAPTDDASASTEASSALASRSPSYDKEHHKKGNLKAARDGFDRFGSNGAGFIPQFPSVLHWMLTEALPASSNPSKTNSNAAVQPVDTSILSFLPHGQAFRIVRWDAFRRDIVPGYFPTLVGADTMGSIDAFLWHLQAWGFEEIKDGPDAGAFASTHFRRGHPKLCSQMTFKYQFDEIHKEKTTILRVPSLASQEIAGMEKVPVEYQRALSYGAWANSPVLPASSGGSVTSLNGPPIFVNYPEELNLASNGEVMRNQQYAGGAQWRHPATPPTAHGMALANVAAPSYSPCRIRSARGARRLSMQRSPVTNIVASAVHNNEVVTAPHDDSRPTLAYPVSNRGRGRHVAASTLLSHKCHSRDEGTPAAKGAAAALLVNVDFKIKEEKNVDDRDDQVSTTKPLEVVPSTTVATTTESNSKTTNNVDECDESPSSQRRAISKRKLPFVATSSTVKTESSADSNVASV